MKKKYIIGLGCSWTQGEGGYPDEIVKQYNGRVQISNRGKNDYHLRKYELENSWVNQLARDHFPDYTPLNLGIKGIGNRAAVHQLHFVDNIDWSNSTGIIVFMMSGVERFDFFREHPKTISDHRITQPDGYSNGEFEHNKWRTMWPAPDNGGEEGPLWNCYAKMLWSEQFAACEQMMALLDLQAFAKAHGFKVVIANAFNHHNPQGIKYYLQENAGSLANKFDWNGYIHDEVPYIAFMQKLVWCDGLMDPMQWGGFYQFYKQRDWPAEYLTNCDGSHPTTKGYKVIADELAEFIKLRGYA